MPILVHDGSVRFWHWNLVCWALDDVVPGQHQRGRHRRQIVRRWRIHRFGICSKRKSSGDDKRRRPLTHSFVMQAKCFWTASSTSTRSRWSGPLSWTATSKILARKTAAAAENPSPTVYQQSTRTASRKQQSTPAARNQMNILFKREKEKPESKTKYSVYSSF